MCLSGDARSTRCSAFLEGMAMGGQRLDDQPGSTEIHGRDGGGIGTGVWLSLPWWLGLGVLLAGCWH